MNVFSSGKSYRGGRWVAKTFIRQGKSLAACLFGWGLRPVGPKHGKTWPGRAVRQFCCSRRSAFTDHARSGIYAISGNCLIGTLGAGRVPDSLRFLLILACLGGVGYGAMWALATFAPEQTQIVKPLSNADFSK